MTASAPYTSQNGVPPVGVLAVVRYAHRMLGNSSGQMPFAPLEPGLNDLEQGLVRDLDLPIGLWVCRR